MGRGFFGGVVWGTVVAALMAGTASVLVGVDKDRAPSATALEVPAGSQFNQTRDDSEAVLPQPQSTPEAAEAPRVQAPDLDTMQPAEIADKDTASQPQTGMNATEMNAPSAGVEANVMVQGDAPVLPNPQSMAPQVPVTDNELSISTDPAQPAAPSVPAEESAAFPKEEVAVVVPQAVPVPAPVATPEPAETNEVAQKEVMEPEAKPEPTPSNTPELPVQDDPVQSAEAPSDETAPSIGKQAGSLKNLAPKVATNRLPSLGQATAPAAQDPVAEPTDTSDQTRFEKYSEAFDNKDEKPLMSIVLVDDGSGSIGIEALASFPYPLTFAVDPTWTGAADAMATYRARGFEVLALADLPEGAAASDSEVALAAGLNALPEAIGLMEKTEGALQADREISDQVAAIAGANGIGLVLFPKGLNTAQKLAVKDGVAAATVFRDFDGKGQNEGAIRRFLDQAAFKAGHEKGGVIMVGRLQPATVSALILWGLQDRASRVALAPVSAVLKAQQAQN